MSTEEQRNKCLQIGKEAINKHDYDRAIHFIEKSIRISPSQYANDLLAMATNHKNNGLNGKSRSKECNGRKEREISRASEYKAEDEARCKDLLRKKDYYSILGVDKRASTLEIKKAYKKLALRYHPDKNKAPSATEAFKKVSQSFACLSKEDKRRYYDETGGEEKQPTRRNGRYEEQEFYDNPFDMFNDLFGGGSFFGGPDPAMQRHNQYNRGHQYQHTPRQALQNKWRILFQFAPFFLIILVTIIYSFFVPQEPLYHIEKGGNYYLQRFTSSNRFPYYVSSDFREKVWDYSQEQLHALERKIDADYLNTASYGCKREQNILQQYKYQVRVGSSRVRNYYNKQLRDFRSIWCERLDAAHAQQRRRG